VLAVALLGAVAVGVFGAALDRRLAALHASPALRSALQEQAARLAEARVPDQVAGAERERVARALAESFVSSFRAMTLTAAGLALASAFCARLTIGRGRGASSSPGGTPVGRL
jgi:hypothetical protein